MKNHNLNELIHLLQQLIADEVHMSIESLDVDQYMGAFGLNSINSIYVLERLENVLGLELNPLLFYDYPTIRTFCEHILKEGSHS